MKDSGMRIRVEQELRDAFVAACQKLDVPAAQVLREHMKKVVSQVSQPSQASRNSNKKQEATF
jgi:antitoxin component of RelBE/YafQ-DinJ toxin-antitoxin module